MADHDARPILSSRADDPEVQPEIERFVVELGERVDALQDAESGRDWEQLGTLARRLLTDAGRLGFSYLASAAGSLEAACQDEDSEAARKGVVEITGVARRIRLGHRGAA